MGQGEAPTSLQRDWEPLFRRITTGPQGLRRIARVRLRAHGHARRVCRPPGCAPVAAGGAAEAVAPRLRGPPFDSDAHGQEDGDLRAEPSGSSEGGSRIG